MSCLKAFTIQEQAYKIWYDLKQMSVLNLLSWLAVKYLQTVGLLIFAYGDNASFWCSNSIHSLIFASLLFTNISNVQSCFMGENILKRLSVCGAHPQATKVHLINSLGCSNTNCQFCWEFHFCPARVFPEQLKCNCRIWLHNRPSFCTSFMKDSTQPLCSVCLQIQRNWKKKH